MTKLDLQLVVVLLGRRQCLEKVVSKVDSMVVRKK